MTEEILPMQRLLFRLGLCALATLSSSSGAVAVTRPASLAADARVVPVPGLPEVAEGTPQIDLFLSGTTDLSTDGCGSATSFAVPPGTDIRFCYFAANTGSVTFTRHDLDDMAGNVFTGLPVTVNPGFAMYL